MASAEQLTIRVSTKGQVILPKSIRQRRHWDAGTRLVVEDTAEGVLLKAAPIFERTRPEDVFGSLEVAAPPKTLDEMDAGVCRRNCQPTGMEWIQTSSTTRLVNFGVSP
ncbi:MAG: AbrB/MazE/SpoVT family DNA-binding domain-containing protein [Methylocystis sp.]|nr:AbrB/MazE/SpoVT family DNA-binding domain-containing protein [Methylocystis sp.]MBI3275933.1 AbrB/MazE/SpoVT family DNA-binding domain-containing protein [Methylocystis sp.]